MRAALIAVLALTGPAFGQSAEETALVRSVFEKLNPRSIAENVEYCGYIGRDRHGRLFASKPNRGQIDTCVPYPPRAMVVVEASYHTHGAYSLDFYNEMPSGSDMEADEAEGIDGWVATPGGRLWYIDTEQMDTWLVCGRGCLPADPAFVGGSDGIIPPRFAYSDLVRRLGY